MNPVRMSRVISLESREWAVDGSLCEEFAAEQAGFAVTTSGRAMFASVEDDLEVQLVP